MLKMLSPLFSRIAVRLRRDERGLTLIELLVAMSLFVVLVGAAVLGVSSALNVTRQNRNRSIAAHLASQEMDSVRTAAIEDFKALPLGRVESTENVDGVPYTVQRDTEWVTEDANSGACDGISGPRLAFLRVDVSVLWPNMQGVLPVGSSTVLTPPVSTYDPYTGHIAVKVLDRDAQPQAGLLVTLTWATGSTFQTTTAEGCAFFAYLAPGDYTVSLGTIGYVDGQGNPVPSQPAVVTVGAVSSVQFDYDLASTLELALAGDQGGLVPADVAVTLANTHLLPLGMRTFPGVGSVRTITSLFPYLDGYQAWTGECADADPEGEKSDGSGPYYPGAQRPEPLPTTPGGITPGTVVAKSVDVHVEDDTGVPLNGAVVVATHAPDAGCGAGSVLTLGVTDASGDLRAALPYGLWTFEVQNEIPESVWPSEIMDPRDSSVPFVDVEVQS